MHVTTLLVPLVAAMFVAALYLSARWARRWRGMWRGAALLPAIVLAVWALSAVTAWPSEHNLWPLELVLYCPAALLYLALLWGIRRIVERRRSATAR
ncbi:MAG: hypothetical protein ABII00_02650 [Elusimicrobiota bacterium]